MAHRSAADPYFGVVKAAKLLTFVDFAAYVRTGDTITGAQYLKLEAGPVPRQFQPTLNLLKAKGELDVAERAVRTRTQKRVLPTPKTDWSALTPFEIGLADEFLERHKEDSATDVRNLSHELPGWAMVELKQEIPPHTAYITLEGPTEKDYRDGEELAQRFGWR